MMSDPKKTCFLITPIGESGGPIRNRVDQWLKLIYRKALRGKNYNIIRADSINDPGKITTQVLDFIVSADLVIIDFTNLNPNVMYESAIRHIVEKPYIQISPAGQRFPFDIQDFRNIIYDPEKIDYPKELAKTIREVVEKIEKPGYKPPKVLTDKFDLKNIGDSKDFEKKIAEVVRSSIKKANNGLVKVDNRNRLGGIDPFTPVQILPYSAGGGAASSYSVFSKASQCPSCGSRNVSKNPSHMTSWSDNNYHCNDCSCGFSVMK